MWEMYLLLAEIEAAFKNLKSDLRLRPIYHQLEERIEAHIFVAFLASCLHVTLRGKLRPLAPGLTPRAVLDKLACIQMLDVYFPTTDGRTVFSPLHQTRERSGAAASDAEAQFARPTATEDHVGLHSDIAMTASPVVPTLQDPTTGNRPPGALFGASCERRANATEPGGLEKPAPHPVSPAGRPEPGFQFSCSTNAILPR